MNRGRRGERQTDRQTDRQSETETDTDTQRQRKTDRQTDRQAETEGQRNRQTDKQTGTGTETLAKRDRPSGVIMRFVHGLVSRAQRTNSTAVLTGGHSASSRLLPPRRYRPSATFLPRSLGSWPR